MCESVWIVNFFYDFHSFHANLLIQIQNTILFLINIFTFLLSKLILTIALMRKE